MLRPAAAPVASSATSCTQWLSDQGGVAARSCGNRRPGSGASFFRDRDAGYFRGEAEVTAPATPPSIPDRLLPRLPSVVNASPTLTTPVLTCPSALRGGNPVGPGISLRVQPRPRSARYFVHATVDRISLATHAEITPPAPLCRRIEPSATDMTVGVNSALRGPIVDNPVDLSRNRTFDCG